MGHHAPMTIAKFATAEAAKAYLLAGKATVTLRSARTGTRFTYRFRRGKRDGSPVFVSVLTGSDNTGDYSYHGAIFSSKFTVKTSGWSQIGPDAPSARALAWALGKLSQGLLPDTLEIWHEGRCGKCGRALTDPESIAAGLGPICRAG